MPLSILVPLVTASLALSDAIPEESKGTCALQTKVTKNAAVQPLTCSAEEMWCHDPMTMTESCHPKSAGCPVTCLPGEHVCHEPQMFEGSDAYNYCSSYTCPVYCRFDEVWCHDPNTMVESCHNKTEGCPVTCYGSDHLCHMPPSCEGCEGYNWCQSVPCPAYCSMDEVHCYDSATMIESCHPLSAGCPVTCSPGESLCHEKPTCDTCQGYNYCHHGACPVYCEMHEVMCHDPSAMINSCHNKTEGCPVTCFGNEHVCHTPPQCEGCDGYNWCQSSPCPAYCGTDEVHCYDSATMMESCHPLSAGCPVTCSPGDSECHEPPTCDSCPGHNYCHPGPCPVICGVDEVVCHDVHTMTDSCHPASIGCPVTCPPGDTVCHMPPTCDTCQGYDYCHPGSCPVHCGMHEVMCHDPSTMTDSCHKKCAGCPVTCPAGENVCHMPPQCEGCDGYNWCQPSPCPVTCGMNEMVCHDSNTMTDTCYPASSGCPVSCAAHEYVCHTAPTCQGCHGGGSADYTIGFIFLTLRCSHVTVVGVELSC
ncbi:brcc3 [Symbiodinium natans]|uniref:Brcc3 protein n=1 Tax=Symbiodinium natans TaxID=878477 RepID=A0A812UV88_9DINO|nr:brcc3 [Symbiodinium natans]